MKLRDVQPHTVAAVWVVVLSLHGAFFAASMIRHHRENVRESARLDSIAAYAQAHPPTDSAKRLLRQFLQDSLGITWQRHSSTLEVKLPPQLQQSVGQAADSIAAGLGRMMPGIIAYMLAVLIGPELVLAGLTGLWLMARRRRPPAVASNSIKPE